MTKLITETSNETKSRPVLSSVDCTWSSCGSMLPLIVLTNDLLLDLYRQWNIWNSFEFPSTLWKIPVVFQWCHAIHMSCILRTCSRPPLSSQTLSFPKFVCIFLSEVELLFSLHNHTGTGRENVEYFGCLSPNTWPGRSNVLLTHLHCLRQSRRQNPFFKMVHGWGYNYFVFSFQNRRRRLNWVIRFGVFLCLPYFVFRKVHILHILQLLVDCNAFFRDCLMNVLLTTSPTIHEWVGGS